MMLVGLKSNTTEVEKRETDSAFITKLKVKTEQVNTLESKISKTMSKAKKVMKFAIPQS